MFFEWYEVMSGRKDEIDGWDKHEIRVAAKQTDEKYSEFIQTICG
jgi:hypothetical protein